MARWAGATRSRVAFDIEEVGGGAVKPDLVHDGFEPGRDVLRGISGGWPAVVASLKRLLETGSPLPAR
jgi:uncharacterized protein YndB with AHSA1/START domain